MALIRHIHRDRLGRVIKHGDYVVWNTGMQTKELTLGEVVQTYPQMVGMRLLDDTLMEREDRRLQITKVRPSNVVVVTAQIQANIEGNVGTLEVRNESN